MVGGQRHAPAALLAGMTQYPLCRRQGGPQGCSIRVRKMSPPPEIDSRTVQAVSSRCTDYAIPAHFTYGTLSLYVILRNGEVDFSQFVLRGFHLTLRLLMSYIYIYIYIYIYGAPIFDVSRSHTTTQHSR